MYSSILLGLDDIWSDTWLISGVRSREISGVTWLNVSLKNSSALLNIWEMNFTKLTSLTHCLWLKVTILIGTQPVCTDLENRVQPMSCFQKICSYEENENNWKYLRSYKHIFVISKHHFQIHMFLHTSFNSFKLHNVFDNQRRKINKKNII